MFFFRIIKTNKDHNIGKNIPNHFIWCQIFYFKTMESDWAADIAHIDRRRGTKECEGAKCRGEL
jgi:hypothetical protein